MKDSNAVSSPRIHTWDFCFRSLFKEYGLRFLSGAVLCHPVKTLKGLKKYRKFLLARPSGQAPLPLTSAEEDVLLEKIRKNPSNLLVGLGFCLKPYRSKNPQFSCPSGRASHDCLYLEEGKTQQVCLSCVIFKISGEALEKGFRVYIMTSAEDMALDFLIPQIATGTFPLSLLFLCPYSVQMILPVLFICQAEFFLFTYSKGNCRNYKQWREADLGKKEEVTEIDASTLRQAFDIFKEINPLEPRPRSFVRKGNIFSPGERTPGSSP